MGFMLCVIPSSCWAGPSDSLLTKRIRWKTQCTTQRLGHRKQCGIASLSSGFLALGEASCRVVPHGKVHVMKR